MATKHASIEANGIRMHIAEEGEGPLVIMCHGFPECWYSWRHQLRALAAAGYRAVAPDMRGFGKTDRPSRIDQYTLLHMVGDMVGLLDTLGEPQAVIAGHDWGGHVAWWAALLRPDRFRAVISLSTPLRPRSTERPTTVMPQTDEEIFYQIYFQQPGVAEPELERDTRKTMRSMLFGASGDRGDAEGLPRIYMLRRGTGLLDRLGDPAQLPEWITELDIDYYTIEFERTGFAGGLNWYRNLDHNWEILAPFAGLQVTVPALYVVGDRDIVVTILGIDQLKSGLAKCVPDLRGTIVLPGCGHWTQQERPQEVNSAMICFLKGLD
jgi:pimeloyl-ACP methyl ester carboxylesterase